jgi:hypothetical protein
MFDLPKSKILPFNHGKDDISFYNLSNDNEFPIRRYIEHKYKCSPSFFYTDEEYSGELLNFLLKKAKLISFTSVGKLILVNKDTFNGLRGGTFWFYYKDVYIRASLKDQPDDTDHSFTNASLSNPPNTMHLESDKKYSDDKSLTLTFVAPVIIQKYPLADFEPFIQAKAKGKVHIFIKDQYGDYDFEPIKINTPKDLDVGMNYGEKFIAINDTIIERLTKNSSGLYMFHGSPGTGKTTFIKYLTSQIEKDFIYVPTNMLEYFTTDPNCLSILMKRPNSVIILEDAEKAILKRESGENNACVSSLLNLSDGIMSDIMKIAIILTYNCPKQNIDEALRRKGRLLVDYEFKPLSKDDAVALAKFLEYPDDFIEEKITEEMALADIYNLKMEIDFQGKKKDVERVIGFGK